jgi:RNA polymerase sigma factor for flagellar operon FliA
MATGHEVSVESGQTLFERHLDDIERVVAFVAARHRLSAQETEDFSSDVMLRLLEDDSAVLRRFQGRSSMRTYLAVVIQRLLLDFRVKAWGKWRPSAEAKRSGELAMLLERLLVRDGHSLEEAIELLAARHGVAAPRSAVEAIVAALPVRVRRRFASEEALESMPSPTPGPDEAILERDDRVAARRLAAALQEQVARLDDEDRVVLAMRFDDGAQVAQIAAALHLDQKATYRRIARILKGLRASLEDQGFDGRAVQALLDAADPPEGDGAAEFQRSRPSNAKGAAEWR